eukprot:9311409-Lingulodinium_polyedra.AAC.1
MGLVPAEDISELEQPQEVLLGGSMTPMCELQGNYAHVDTRVVSKTSNGPSRISLYTAKPSLDTSVRSILLYSAAHYDVAVRSAAQLSAAKSSPAKMSIACRV